MKCISCGAKLRVEYAEGMSVEQAWKHVVTVAAFKDWYINHETEVFFLRWVCSACSM